MTFKQLLPVSLHDGLLAMNLSPLYLFPITIVFVSALLVFVFGFTRSVTEPPTLHLLASDGKDKKSQKRSRREKLTKDKSNGGLPNGTVKGISTLCQQLMHYPFSPFSLVYLNLSLCVIR